MTWAEIEKQTNKYNMVLTYKEMLKDSDLEDTTRRILLDQIVILKKQ